MNRQINKYCDNTIPPCLPLVINFSVQRNSDFRTPLHLATERGLFEAARGLIELGSDINAVAKVRLLTFLFSFHPAC